MAPCAEFDSVKSDTNVIEDIAFGASGVEIHLLSSRAFPVRAIPPVLEIGSARFDRSHRPPDGDLTRLIFLIPPKTYAKLHAGDPVQVHYGQGASPRERWDFGPFSKK